MCQCSAMQYCAGLHDNLRKAQYISTEHRVRSERCTGSTIDLPEDVLGLAAGQSNLGTGAHGERLRYLEDENSIRVSLAVESDTKGVTTGTSVY